MIQNTKMLVRPSGAVYVNAGAPPRSPGSLSLLAQRKRRKERAPPEGTKTPSPPRLWGPRGPDTRSISCGSVAHFPVRDPCGALTQSLAGRGRALRGTERRRSGERAVLASPYGAPEPFRFRPASPNGALPGAAPRAQHRDRAVARAWEVKAKRLGSIRAIRGVLSFGYLSLHEQRKVTLGAGAEHPANSLSGAAEGRTSTHPLCICNSFITFWNCPCTISSR